MVKWKKYDPEMDRWRKDDRGTAKLMSWRKGSWKIDDDGDDLGTMPTWRKDGGKVKKDWEELIEENWRNKTEKKIENHQTQRPYGFGPWSSLPDDILLEISKRLDSFADHIAMRCTCYGWRSFFLLRNTLSHNSIPIAVPCLLLPQSRKPNPHLLYYNIKSNKVERMLIPKLSSHYRCAAHQGWLVLLGNNSPSMSLFNPLTNISIQLPPLATFSGVVTLHNIYIVPSHNVNNIESVSLPSLHLNFIDKVVLSPNPTSTNYTAMTKYSINSLRKLAICKSGHNEWTTVQELEKVDDFVHHKGKFYASYECKFFQICNLEDRSLNPIFAPVARLVAEFSLRRHDMCENYLVELPGSLLLLQNSYNSGIGLYGSRFDHDSLKWQPMINFTSHSSFFGIESSLDRDFQKCSPNCIYLIQKMWFPNDNNLKIFNVGKNMVETCRPCPCRFRSKSISFRSKSIWFTPSFF